MDDDRLFPVAAVKRCCTCKQVKPLTDFNRLRRAKDGRQPSCRACNAAYHQKNWARHMAQIRTRKRERVAEAQARLLDYLAERACSDCSETDLLVLEFDHVRDKSDSISVMVCRGDAWPSILAEIAKCEVVCANCHRRRTAKRAKSFRYRAILGDE